MVIHLDTSLRIKVNTVEVFPMPTMSLLLILVLRKQLVSLKQNTSNFLVCSILRVTLLLKHHMILLLMLIRLPLSSLSLLWIFKGMRCQVSSLQPNFQSCLTIPWNILFFLHKLMLHIFVPLIRFLIVVPLIIWFIHFKFSLSSLLP